METKAGQYETDLIGRLLFAKWNILIYLHVYIIYTILDICFRFLSDERCHSCFVFGFILLGGGSVAAAR